MCGFPCVHVWVCVCVHLYCSYLVLLDAGQIPAKAQTDLPALPVLQEKNRYTCTEENDIQFDESLVASHMWKLQKTI